MTGVFKPSLPIDESKEIGVLGTDQSAEAVIRSFRSYVFGDRHDTIWLSSVTFNPFLAKKLKKNIFKYLIVISTLT